MKIVGVAESIQQTGKECAKKIFFKCDDQCIVEACLLSLKKHGTVICISNQVGCSQACTFCAAGLAPFTRNLTFEEIVQQVDQIMERFPAFFKDKFEVTFMGSGEPLTNYENVKSAIDFLVANDANIRKINISTILPYLNRNLIDDFKQYRGRMHIQYSLHFTDDRKREEVFSRTLPSIQDSLVFLDELAECLDDRYANNYILFDKINDREQDVRDLARLLSGNRGYLKISEMSSINKSKLQRSKNVDRFIKDLKKYNIEYDFFESLGQDVSAGCGQFYNESIL